MDHCKDDEAIKAKAKELMAPAIQNVNFITESLKEIVRYINKNKNPQQILGNVKSKTAFFEKQTNAHYTDYEKELTKIKKTPLVKLIGLSHNLKSVESLQGKLNKKCAEKKQLSPPRDIVRFTFILHQIIFEDTLKLIDNMLKDKQIEPHTNIEYTKNTFCDGNVYKGLNRTYVYNKTFDFEIQYHTELSYLVKSKGIHEIYESYRKPYKHPVNSNSPEAIAERDQKCKEYNAMVIINDKIEDPIFTSKDKQFICKDASIEEDYEPCNDTTYVNEEDYFKKGGQRKTRKSIKNKNKNKNNTKINTKNKTKAKNNSYKSKSKSKKKSKTN